MYGQSNAKSNSKFQSEVNRSKLLTESTSNSVRSNSVNNYQTTPKFYSTDNNLLFCNSLHSSLKIKMSQLLDWTRHPLFSFSSVTIPQNPTSYVVWCSFCLFDNKLNQKPHNHFLASHNLVLEFSYIFWISTINPYGSKHIDNLNNILQCILHTWYVYRFASLNKIQRYFTTNTCIYIIIHHVVSHHWFIHYPGFLPLVHASKQYDP